MRIDDIDRRLIELLTAEPRIGVLEASRRLGVARPTVQAHLDKLLESGAMSLAPTLHPENFGYPVMCFVSVELQQTFLGTPAPDELAHIPEVVEIHSSTGQADLLLKVVARSNSDLQRVLHMILTVQQVVRTSSSIVLTTHADQRMLPLIAAASSTPARTSLGVSP